MGGGVRTCRRDEGGRRGRERQVDEEGGNEGEGETSGRETE